MSARFLAGAAVLVALMVPSLSEAAPHSNLTALEAVTEIAGTYEGRWTMSALDAELKPRPFATWTDKLEATNPRLENGSAVVDATDTMTFHGGHVEVMKFKEGFDVREDGKAGDRFFEYPGFKVHELRTGKHSYTFETPVAQQEMGFLGVDPKAVVFGRHVTVKTTTMDGAVPTEHITRVTTLQLKTESGVRDVQFVSMQGHHRKLVPAAP